MRRKWNELIHSEQHSLQERVFALTIVVMAISFTCFILADAVTGATFRNIAILAVALVLLSLIAILSIRRKRIKTGACIISALVIFVLLPFTFFFGGGISGGPPIWFLYAVLFVGLLLSGRTKIFFLLSELVVAAVCYILAYTRPYLVQQNSTVVAYVDSFAALVLISLAVTMMIGFEITLYQRENARAEQQKQEIETLNAAQSRFFSSMSHEIRTPINTIIGLNEMILREDVSREVAEDAANIQAASKILLHLINDILDMSKLESGSMKLTPVSYRVGDMITELASMFWGQAREKGLEFSVSVAPEAPAELIGDDVRIKQILINVLNNAVKYTKEGSVTLSIQCGAREGNIQRMIYTVTDTGMGIKKESLPYLFTAFKRVDEEKNRHIEGTGLGLSIVRQLVELMGGAITVNSVYTQGSTFIIELPQQVSGEETVGALDMESRPSGSRTAYRSRFEAPEANVLVVDDNASNLLVATKMLRGTKVHADTASSGEEALRMTLEKPYHVIFMDHLMPEMDGVECRRRILSQSGGKCRESKVIILTANADNASQILYEREGFDGYLTKPIDAAELEHELLRCLPRELVRTYAVDDEELLKESIAWLQAPQRKRMVAVSTESSADLPHELLVQHDIAVIPHILVTEHGVFRDAIDLESNGLLSFMATPHNSVKTLAPDVDAFEAFFAEQLKKANNVVYIALSPRVGNSGYLAAMEASASFDNVTVLDSGHLSSGQGLLVLEACRLAEEGKTPAEIAEALEKTKRLVQTSFIVDNLDYLARVRQVNRQVAKFTKALTVRPVLKLRDGRMGVGSAFFGNRRRAWEKYIASCLRTPDGIDTRRLFITYAGLSPQDLHWIRETVEAHIQFENVYFQKAAPSIAVNCGPGTFGLLFLKKEP